MTGEMTEVSVWLFGLKCGWLTSTCVAWLSVAIGWAQSPGKPGLPICNLGVAVKANICRG